MKPRDWSQICDLYCANIIPLSISLFILHIPPWTFGPLMDIHYEFLCSTIPHNPCWHWLLQFHIKLNYLMSNLFNPLLFIFDKWKFFKIVPLNVFCSPYIFTSLHEMSSYFFYECYKFSIMFNVIIWTFEFIRNWEFNVID